jgi:glycerol dehydrogenase-like iron-containing ADH family enzyme
VHAVAHLLLLLQGPKQHVTFGPAHGHQAHYGHFDVIVGRNAQQEVWPHLKAFLEQHDAPASLRQLWDAQLLREGEE